MNDKIKILGLAGSLRKKSYNRALLKAAAELCPMAAELEIFDLADIPIFNQDEENNPPPAVQELKNKIRQADAVVFVSPEYNYSVSGALKNAIDWASRPYGDNSWEGKSAAIMSASGSMLGGARAQYHLRQIFVFLDIHPVNRPEVMVPLVQEKFDEQGRLTDEKTKEKVLALLTALIAWTQKLK